jgi:4-alpha-glucanotransferase
MAARYDRSSGLLLHPTSLPGPHGIGDLGPEAYGFVDFLAAASQRLWQVLPLGPTGYGNSPYAARSAFAGNPLLVSLERLRDEGLIDDADLHWSFDGPLDRVEFSAVEQFKMAALRRAAERFSAEAPPNRRAAFDAFKHQNARWLDDFTLFMALQQSHGGTWQTWGEGLARRRPEALADARRMLATEIEVHAFAQFAFAEQWSALRAYAGERGIQLVGDIPIFVALDSADVWAQPELFLLDDRGFPTVVAGVPPDYFSTTGQRWGNPLYRWDAIAATGYAWWINRFRAMLRLVDVIRIDHFRGFQAHWEIPAEHPTAEHGRWVGGPGRDLFQAARRALGDLPIIVEDLGVITEDVVALREELGYPGMKVLQFAFGSGPSNPFLPHNFEPNVVVYTGTHDNDTTVGWFRSASESERGHALEYLCGDGESIAWDMIRLALASVADLAVAPVQDVLSLGYEARMNFPGKAEGNWAWRLAPGQLTGEHADHLSRLARAYGRVGD